MESVEVHGRVRERYGQAAKQGSGCACGTTCCSNDYAPEELAKIPKASILGLGSGNPVRHGNLREGEVVVDLGSGGGIDVFLAAHQVGPAGRAIGVDMTPEMVARARRAATAAGFRNVEFLEGIIEAIPLPDETADIVLSNCVINLSPDKGAAFREIYRVLRPGGRLVVSDIVQERPLGSVDDACGCVATAMVRRDYLETIGETGFSDIEIVEDRPWLVGPTGRDASSITVKAVKKSQEVNPSHRATRAAAERFAARAVAVRRAERAERNTRRASSWRGRHSRPPWRSGSTPGTTVSRSREL